MDGHKGNIVRSRLRWFGHVMRKDGDRLLQRLGAVVLGDPRRGGGHGGTHKAPTKEERKKRAAKRIER